VYYTESKIRLTRKTHICNECKKVIPSKSNVCWFKSVVFKESDVGRNCWHEFYVCAECDEKLHNELAEVLDE